MSDHHLMMGRDNHLPANIPIENDTGATLEKFRAVKFEAFGTNFFKASYGNGLTDQIAGIVQDDIPDGAGADGNSLIAALNFLTGVDTSSFAVGNMLYAGASGVLSTTINGPSVAQVLFVSATVGIVFVSPLQKGDTGATGVGANSHDFDADYFISPISANYPISNFAGVAKDTNDDEISVRVFDDTTPQSIAVKLEVPTGVTTINGILRSRAEVDPLAVKVVKLDSYVLNIRDNLIPTAWSGATALPDVSIPANEFFQKDTFSVTLASLGMGAGQHYIWLVVRDSADGGDTLDDDWILNNISVEYS